MEDIVKLSGLVQNAAPQACPGCGHLLFYRLIREVLEELEINNRAVQCNGIGCTGVNRPWIDHGYVPLLAHGRAAAVATGLKRTNPDLIVYTFQGDGDAEVIGLSETLGAAYRNENICVFVSLNLLYGLTGGQMAWSTLAGQVTTTTPDGRDVSDTGHPFHMPEMIVRSFPDVAYAARGTITSPANIRALKEMIRNAFLAQLNGEGYSVVECLSVCPNNWHLSPAECLDHVDNVVTREFPLGEFKQRRVRK